MFNISMFFYLFNCIKMNKNFLFLLLIILIIGIIVFVYNYKEINQKIKELFEENKTDNFVFDKNYSKNTIINNNIKYNYDTNYFEIKGCDIDKKQLQDFNSEKPLLNTIFLNFLSARAIANEKSSEINNLEELKDIREINKDFTYFLISNSILIEFSKKNQFLEIEFNSKNNTKILKLTINSIDEKNENINIEMNIDKKEKYSNNNTNKYINKIEFVNKTAKNKDKEDNIKFYNDFYIILYYSDSTNEKIYIKQLEEGLNNHFCENLLNVSVYSNPLNNIAIYDNFLFDIYLENFQPKIKSKRIEKFDLIALTHMTGRIYRPSNNDSKYGSLGDYMYDERKEAYVKIKKSPWYAFAALGWIGLIVGSAIANTRKNKTVDIAYKNLRDALLLSTENEYVIPAERVGYSWDDNFTYLKSKNKNTNSDATNALSFEKRKDPLVLFNLHPVTKNGFIYYPLGDFAYVGAIDDNLLKKTFQKNRGDTNKNDYLLSDYKDKLFNTTIPHVLVREDCLEPIVNQGPNFIWWDAGAGNLTAVDGSAGSYWVKYINYTQKAIDEANSKDSDNGGYKNSDVNNPGNFLAIFNGVHNMGKDFSTHFNKPRNYKIKKDFLIGQPRPSIINEMKTPIIEAIKVKLKNTIEDYVITKPSSNNNVSPYISQINKDKTDSQLKYTTSVNFNKKMENIQKDYDHNFSYIADINTQLSNIRQQEKAFVQNQIKKQLESHKNKIENNIKNQTETLNKYDNDISQTSTTIGNQINEYVVLRKQRELMPTNPQIMY